MHLYIFVIFLLRENSTKMMFVWLLPGFIVTFWKVSLFVPEKICLREHSIDFMFFGSKFKMEVGIQNGRYSKF